jgi:hypothetical protein
MKPIVTLRSLGEGNWLVTDNGRPEEMVADRRMAFDYAHRRWRELSSSPGFEILILPLATCLGKSSVT